MRLMEIMNKKIETISSLHSVDVARRRMKELGIHHLVVSDKKKVQGILFQRDVDAADKNGQKFVSQIMASRVHTARPTTTVQQAAKLLRGYGVDCLLVLERGKVVGIVTITDLLDLLAVDTQRIVRLRPQNSPLGKPAKKKVK